MTPNIADVIYHGIAFDPKNWNTNAMPDSLPQKVDQFLDALVASDAVYTLVGGIALLSYVDGRNTQDIDLIISLKELWRVPGVDVVETSEWFARADYLGLRVDILRPECPVFDIVRSRFSTVREFSGHKLRTATAEGLVTLKLFALPSLYRQFQMEKVAIYEADIMMLMHREKVDTAKLLAVLRRHLEKSDVAEVEQILQGIEAKLKRGR